MYGLVIMIVVLVVFTAIVYIQPPEEQERCEQTNSNQGESFFEKMKSCAIFTYCAFVIIAFFVVGIMSTYYQCSSAAEHDNGYDPSEYYD